MTEIVLRRLDEGLKDKLRLRAAGNGRSMNEELLHIVADALRGPRARTDRSELKRLAADIRALSRGRRQTLSEELLREDRTRL